MTSTLDAVDWRGAAFATGPADRDRAERGVRAAYAAAGLSMPAVVWLPSPLHGAIAAVCAANRTRAGEFVAAGLGLQAELALEALPRHWAGQPVREIVRTLPWESARSAAYAELGPAGWAAACAPTAALWGQVNGLVTQIRRAIGATDGTGTSAGTGTGPGTGPWPGTGTGPRPGPSPSPGTAAGQTPPVGQTLRQVALGAVLGQHDAPWLGVFGQLGRLGGVDGLATVAAEAGWWWPCENMVILTERPTELHRDEPGRLHRADGPALAYGGGFELHAWRGMPMPADFIASLATVTADQIAAETNAELRRAMLECYGFDRYVAEKGATLLDRDTVGKLWRIDLPADEPAVMVEVVNSTPEPDGTSRTYWLRVPPRTRTAREGVAWTFGLTEAEYHPEKQT